MNMSGGRFSNTVLLCDMDGTLLDRESKISEKNREAILSFVQNGGRFTVATGRSEPAVKPYLTHLPVNLPAILYNGAVLYDFETGDILWEDCLEGDVKPVLKELMRVFPEMGVEIYQGKNIYFIREHEVTEQHQKREGFKPVTAKLEDVAGRWYKVILAWDPDKLLEVEKYLGGIRGTFRAVYSEPYFLELLNKGTSKGRGMQKLAEMYRFPLSSVIAMGDNMNDLEMVRMAGLGVVPANGRTELKAAAGWCCRCHDEDAVAEVVEWLFKNAKVDGWRLEQKSRCFV